MVENSCEALCKTVSVLCYLVITRVFAVKCSTGAPPALTHIIVEQVVRGSRAGFKIGKRVLFCVAGLQITRGLWLTFLG